MNRGELGRVLMPLFGLVFLSLLAP
ncbi:MAG: hypothetical protein RLZZ156_1356, partial [Deinococcota bacterium]